MYSCEGKVVYFVFQRTRLPFLKAQIKNICPRQGLKIAGVVLNRVGIFTFFCPKQGQGLRPSAAHLYPNIGRVPPPPRKGSSMHLFVYPFVACGKMLHYALNI